LRRDGRWQGELQRVARDGRILGVVSRWLSTSAGIAEISLDLRPHREAETALVRREALLRSILGTVPDAMIVIAAHGLMQSFSAGAERLFGYAAHEVLGRKGAPPGH